MRGSLFVSSPWARQPLRPIARRMGQTVECDGDVCRITRPGQEPPVTTTPPVVVTPPVVTPPAVVESSFPVVPVIAGVGGLALLALLLRG